MNTDNNGYFSAKDILPLLKQQIDYLENQIAEKCGMKLYKSSNGFTQEEIYEYAGAKDCVATLTLSQESAEVYGELLTVAFMYYQKERIAIEKDKSKSKRTFGRARQQPTCSITERWCPDKGYS